MTERTSISLTASARERVLHAEDTERPVGDDKELRVLLVEDSEADAEF